MKIKKIIFGLVFLTSCISEFYPPSIGYENLLVVEAFLSDDDRPFEVSLSRTTTIDTSFIIPEFGAEVQLLSEQGERYNLYEAGSGRYLSDATINPISGVGYQLFIKTRKGKQYESAIVTMRETPEIDSVTFQFEEKPEAGVKGVQIYINTHDPNNSTWYYRWEWEETWEFYTAFQSMHIYDNGMILRREDDIYRCWKESESSAIKISTSTNLTQDIINKYPLLYVSSETDRLSSKYSVNVKQYALSEESYNYWLELEKVTESLGTLFDPQPSTVYSNIKNVNNDSEVVLGYFDAASVTEERLFIRRGQLPPMRIPDYYLNCEDTIVSKGMIPGLMALGFMLAYETQDEMGNYVYLMSDPWCIDCTLVGTNKEPDFWE